MVITVRRTLAVAMLSILMAATQSSGGADGRAPGTHEIHHIQRVLFISIDGMHALDVANYVKEHPKSTLAKLSAHGVTYTQAWTSKPSDSFPGTIAEFTGGTPVSTGIWYCISYDRKLSPPHSKCATVGTPVRYDQSMDYDPHVLDAGGGINPANLPLDLTRGCSPVYPHQYLRVNTIFEVAKAHGLRTAWSDKHPIYEILNGPSGHGVDDLFNPEISAYAEGKKNYQSSVPLAEKYDDIKVRATLNQIAGKDHTGKQVVGVPAIFGMNFQAINIGQKKIPGGYQDSAGTPSAPLADALAHTDASIGKMVDALAAAHLLESTLIIVSAKHGNAPIDPLQYKRVNPTPRDVAGNAVAFAHQLGISVIWLKDQNQTAEVVHRFDSPAVRTTMRISAIYSGESLRLFANDPRQDSRVPDIVVEPHMGVDYSRLTTNVAEHGGLNVEDRNVALVVTDYGNPRIAGDVIKTSVDTTQLAPTMAIALGLNPLELQAVRKEKTVALPEF